MSDESPGPGWWQASDLKWYPPERQPGYAAPPPPPPGPEAVGQQPSDPDVAAKQQLRPSPATVPTAPKPGRSGQRRAGLIAASAVIVVIVAAGITGYHLRQPPPPPPVAEGALDGLLLSPDQIAAASNTTTPMTVNATFDDMFTTTVSDPACVGVGTVRDTHAYAGSGWRAIRGNQIFDHHAAAAQFVVLFPSAHDAQAFFTASAQKWPTCANRQFTETRPNYTATKTVGLVSNANGTLSAAWNVIPDEGSFCGHALTVANNIAIDAVICLTRSAAAVVGAVKIVNQIAAKVPTK